MNTLTKTLNKMAVSASILKARCNEALERIKNKEGAITDYTWAIIIGIVIAGIILVVVTTIIKNDVNTGLKTKISEFFSFT